MGRVGLKIGLVAAVLLLIAVATIGTVSAGVYVSFTNNTTVADKIVQLYFKDVTNKTDTTNTLNVTYRDTFSIQVYYINTSLFSNARYVDIYFYRITDGVMIAEYTDLVQGKEIQLNTYDLGMKPTLYWFKVVLKDGDKNAICYFTSRNESDLTIGTKSIRVGDNPDSYYDIDYLNISVDPSQYSKPLIEVEVKNPNNKVAIGDDIRIKVKVWGADTAHWEIKKYNSSTPAPGLTYGVISDTSNDNYVEDTIVIPTYELFNNSTIGADPGEHTIKIWSADSEVEVVISIEKPTVTANVDSDKVVPQAEIKISGTTNVAETDSDYDNDTTKSNYVLFFVFNTTDIAKEQVKWNQTARNFTVEYGGQEYVICNLTSYFNQANARKVGLKFNPLNYMATIDSDGKFSEKIDLSKAIDGADTGDWEVVVAVMTVTNETILDYTLMNESKIVTSRLIGKDVVYFSVEEPTIEFTMDTLTFARGEDFKITGKTNLPEGSTLYIVFERASDLSSDISGNSVEAVSGGVAVNVTVGAGGKFETDEYTIKSNAPLAYYKVYAVWDTNYNDVIKGSTSSWDKYEMIKIKVVSRS